MALYKIMLKNMFKSTINPKCAIKDKHAPDGHKKSKRGFYLEGISQFFSQNGKNTTAYI